MTKSSKGETSKRSDKQVVKSASSTKCTMPRKPLSFEVQFDIKEMHQKALLVLWRSHHANQQTLTYSQLSDAMGVSEKTKAWQCEAWKDLKTSKLIVPASADSGGKGKKTLTLSPQGLELAEHYASDEELADSAAPLTNEALHEKICSRLDRSKGGDKKSHSGSKIFKFMLEHPKTPMTALELAHGLKTNPDSHGFFYGLKALKGMGLVSSEGKVTKNELAILYHKLYPKAADSSTKIRVRGGLTKYALSDKAFLTTEPEPEVAKEGNEGETEIEGEKQVEMKEEEKDLTSEEGPEVVEANEEKEEGEIEEEKDLPTEQEPEAAVAA